MKAKEIEKIEIDVLLEGIFRRYGHNFHNYARASLKRRLKKLLHSANLKHYSEILPKVLHDENFFHNFILNISVTVTEMFRDPAFFKVIRQKIIPVLKTYPFIKIWHSGCATGEEVYSMAIILKEEGLLSKAHIYATDINTHSLEIAKEGIYPLENIKTFTKNYIQSGGKHSFSDFYHAKYNSVKLRDYLKENITFAAHNLATDNSFGEMNMIICRNVLIYFDNDLQSRAYSLFDKSLCRGSFLCLGSKETLDYSNVSSGFESFAKKEKIYRKRSILNEKV